jgi:DNA-directed RNA polymerase subunit RPC12/RpoP
MSSIYDEIEIEDMIFDKETEIYTYPCPCGDKFTISLEELIDGEEIATCPSCTLRIKVIFDEDALPVSLLMEKELLEESSPE